MKYSKFQLHNSPINTTCLANSNKYLLSGSNDSIKITNLASKVNIGEIVSSSVVNSISLNQNNDKFVASSTSITLYDMNKLTKVKNFTNKIANFRVMESRFMNDQLLVSCGYDCQLKLYDLRSTDYRPVSTYKDATDNINCLDFVGTRITCGSTDNRLYTYDLRKGIVIIDNLQNPIIDVACAADGDIFALLQKGEIVSTSSDDGLLSKRFKISETSLNYKLNHRLYGEVLVCGSEAGKVSIWKTDQTDQPLEVFSAKDNLNNGNVISCVELYYSHLVACSGSGVIHFWDDINVFH